MYGDKGDFSSVVYLTVYWIFFVIQIKYNARLDMDPFFVFKISKTNIFIWANYKY